MLLLLPLVSAGTPDDPEITDPVGDSVDTGQAGALGAPVGDLVAAWFEPTGGTEVDVFIELAELREQDSLRIDARWHITGPFDGAPEPGYGVRLWLTPNGDQAVQLRPDVDQGPPLALEVVRGAPATIHVQSAWTGGREWGGGAITDFEVTTFPSPPVGNLVPAVGADNGALDDAGPGRDLVLPWDGPVATKPWNITGTLRAESPAEDDIPGPVDLTGLWVGSNGTGFDLTARLRSMTPEEAAACQTLRVFLYVGGATPDGVTLFGSSSVTFQGGWVVRTYEDFKAEQRRDYDTVGSQEFPYEMRWTFGTPGFFQFHAKDVDVPLDQPSIRMYCNDLNDSLDEPFRLGDVLAESAPFLLPAFFAMMATIVGTILVKRKGNRRH